MLRGCAVQIKFCPLLISTIRSVVWRSACAQLGHHHEDKHGDAILSPKTRGAVRIALRCHPIAQIGQPRMPARL